MTLQPDSPEWQRLVSRWLDQTATEEEADLLWQVVTSNPDAARELAAAARFDALLTETVKARQIETDHQQAFSLTRHGTQSPSSLRPTSSLKPSPALKVLAAAAAITVMGFISALLWPSSQPSLQPVSAAQHVVTAPTPALEETPRLPPPSPRPAIDLPSPQITSHEVPITDRLDRFFIRDIHLDHVPLSQALSLLQSLLQETDSDHTLDLAKLRMEVPAGASARRVSFHSSSMAFLKAVRAVAALAGCEVRVSEPTITLTLLPGIYPQLTEKRQLSELLMGRLNPDGSPMLEDSQRLEQLWEDAAQLGIQVQEDGSAAISRGQWEALRMLSDSRDQVSRLPMPTFAMYLVPAEAVPENRALTPAELADFQIAAQKANLQPLTTITPKVSSGSNADPLIVETKGDEVNVALNTGSQDSSAPTVLKVGSLSAMQGSSYSYSGSGSMLRVSSTIMKQLIVNQTTGLRATSASVSGSTTSASSTQAAVVIVPTTPAAP